MADKKTYYVLRAMQGDKDYERGDTRELTEADAAPLVASGALVETGGDVVVREPAVRHTFGRDPRQAAGYTTATVDGVVPGQPATVSVPIRKAAPAKAPAKA